MPRGPNQLFPWFFKHIFAIHAQLTVVRNIFRPSRGQLFSTPDAGTRGYITDDRLWRGMEEYDRHRRREARRRQREEEHRMYRDLDMTSFTRYYAEKVPFRDLILPSVERLTYEKTVVDQYRV